MEHERTGHHVDFASGNYAHHILGRVRAQRGQAIAQGALHCGFSIQSARVNEMQTQPTTQRTHSRTDKHRLAHTDQAEDTYTTRGQRVPVACAPIAPLP